MADIEVIAVDMGEGGPASEYARILEEANEAMMRALAIPASMLTDDCGPSYRAMQIHNQIRDDILRGRR